MKKPRVLFLVEKEMLFRRLFYTVSEKIGFDQAICVPNQECAANTKIKKRYTKISEHNFQSAVLDYRPNVFVVCDEFKQTDWVRSKGIKTVFAMHGEWPKTKKNTDNPYSEYYQRFNLLCGGMTQFKDFFKDIPSYKHKILTSALLQYDSLFAELQIQEWHRNRLFSFSKTRATKIITLFGPKTIDSGIHSPHNEGFYRSTIKLGELARQNNWILFIKPKRDNIFEFIRKKCKNKDPQYDWARELYKPFNNLRANPNVRFVDVNSCPYQYFCSDLLITNSRSNLEIEASLANKPVIKIYSDKCDKTVSDYNIYGTLDFKAAYTVCDVNAELEDRVIMALNGDNSELIENQKKFIKHLGILFDGQAHLRILEAIKNII